MYQSRDYSVYLARKEVKDSLNEYVKAHPHGTYEEWMRESLPENVSIGRHGQPIVEKRFWLKDADALRYWHNHVKNERDKSKWEMV